MSALIATAMVVCLVLLCVAAVVYRTTGSSPETKHCHRKCQCCARWRHPSARKTPTDLPQAPRQRGGEL